MSVGTFASAVHIAAGGTDVLLENFTSVADWTGSLSSVAGGRTGNMGQISGSGAALFTIPGANESATITVGFAFKVTSIASIRLLFQFYSDTGTFSHNTFQVNTDGSIIAKLGGTGGAALGTTATGLIAINTWNYVEAQALLGDSPNGTLKLRVNGVERLNLTGIDTKAGGTKTVYDALRLSSGGSGTTHNFDDLYITMGAGATFKGDTSIP